MKEKKSGSCNQFPVQGPDENSDSKNRKVYMEGSLSIKYYLNRDLRRSNVQTNVISRSYRDIVSRKRVFGPRY